VGPITAKMMAKVHGSQWTSWAHRAATTVWWCLASATTFPVSYWFNPLTSGSHVLYDTAAMVLWLYLCAGYWAWLLDVLGTTIFGDRWFCVI
jgi:hypothetical protein